MKTQPAKPKHTDLLEEASHALVEMRDREKCLRTAIAEGVCGLTPDSSLDEAEQLLRQGAREGWAGINESGWAPKGYGCFEAKDGTTFIFPI